MNLRPLARLLTITAAAVLPAVAFAHPGHDGHDFGWDFRGTPGHAIVTLALLGGLVAAGVWAVSAIVHARNERRAAKQSLVAVRDSRETR